MALTKYKIGDLITTVDERNTIGIRDFYGININKEFMPTVANTEGLDERKYKVVRKNRFVYSGMQTGRDECIRISMYTKDKPILVSPAYVTFEVTALSTVLPLYFFLRFLTKEKDRYGAFCSDGSIRSNLDWEVFCDMNIELPSIEIQQKYVDVYNAMLANQQSYEHGLDDLKLTCDAYIEELRRKTPCEKIGKYLSECNERNNVGLTVNNVRGIATSKEFIDTKANMDGVSLSNYKMIHPNEIAYISDTSRRGDKISLAMNSSDEMYLVSSISTVFRTNKEHQRQIVKDFFIKFTKNLQKRCQKHCMAPDTSFDRLHFSVQQVFAEIRIVWQLVDIWLPAPLDFGQFQRIGCFQCMIVACHI